jgi:hypothetical protein
LDVVAALGLQRQHHRGELARRELGAGGALADVGVLAEHAPQVAAGEEHRARPAPAAEHLLLAEVRERAGHVGVAADAAGADLVGEAVDTPAGPRTHATILTQGVTNRDVTDIARWTQHKTAHTDAYSPAPTRLRDLLARLRRDAPAAIDGLDTVIDHARTTYRQHVDPDSICEAFQTLTNELARTRSRRDRFEMARR